MPPIDRARRLLAASAAVGALTAVVATAPAGVPLVDTNGVPYRWNLARERVNVLDGQVTYFLDPRTTSDSITGGKSALDALRDAARAWEVPTTNIRFREDATRPATGKNGTDGVNWIGWADGVLSPLTYAATFPMRDGNEIIDADIVFNDRDFNWDTRTPGVSGVADIQGITAHEWGHLLGADHVPLRSSTMYFASDPGTIHLRSLADDDVALVSTIYPNTAFLATTGTLRGTVDLTDANDDRAVHVIAVSVATAEPAASTLSAPDGTYEIRGLPPGSYRVIMAPTLPLGTAMNAYWRSGRTNFLPTVASPLTGGTPGTPNANPARAATLRVLAGTTVTVPTMRASAGAPAPLEPNDTPETATPLTLGDAACGRFESASDLDYFAIPLTQGQRVTFGVLGWGLGADLDPSMQLTDAAGRIVSNVIDIRSGPAFTNQPQGVDRDARIIGFDPPTTGIYRVRVGRTSSASGTNTFYVLFATAASDTPSSQLSTATAAPARIDADGVSTATILVHPVREDALDVGTGAVVALLHDGGGQFSPVKDQRDGTYRAIVTAPNTAGTDQVSVTITTAVGTAAIANAARLVYLGPADPSRSTLTVVPRRIADDGSQAAAINFVPVDARGEALGDGRVITFVTNPSPSLSVGQVVSAGGKYVAPVVASAPGRVDFAVSVAGAPVGLSAPLFVGFEFEDVTNAARADLASFLATPSLPTGAMKKFAKADLLLADAVRLFGNGDREPVGGPARQAVARARSALTKITKGLARAAPLAPDPGTAHEIALSIRRLATIALGRAIISNGRDQRNVDAAQKAIAAGDGFLAAGNPKRAAAKWASAMGRVARLVE